MQVIADQFPNSVLVFATLKDEFSDAEKTLLMPFVKACRTYGKLDRPRNAVLLLTGSELFSMSGPPRCWKGKAGKAGDFADARRPISSLVELCEATQSIYFGLDPWWADWKAEFDRRRAADSNSSSSKPTASS